MERIDRLIESSLLLLLINYFTICIIDVHVPFQSITTKRCKSGAHQRSEKLVGTETSIDLVKTLQYKLKYIVYDTFRDVSPLFVAAMVLHLFLIARMFRVPNLEQRQRSPFTLINYLIEKKYKIKSMHHYASSTKPHRQHRQHQPKHILHRIILRLLHCCFQ